MCGLTLAWVTSENSTKQLECRHIDSIFLAGPYLLCYCLTAPVSGVNSCPWFHANSSADSPLCCPAANSHSAPFSNQLPFASPYHFRIRRDFRSKNPLFSFAPKQTKESSARATHIVLQTVLFEIIQLSISTQFKCKYGLIVKNVSILSYSVYSIHFNISMPLVLFNP